MVNRKPNILVAAGDGGCECLTKNLSALGDVTVTQTIESTMHRLRSGDFDVLFCAWDMAGGSWSDLLAALKEEALELPTIVYYHCGGEVEWAQALDGGAFDLLVPPFESYKLAVLLEHAMASSGHVDKVA